jgi:hypothetical protein
MASYPTVVVFTASDVRTSTLTTKYDLRTTGSWDKTTFHWKLVSDVSEELTASTFEVLL